MVFCGFLKINIARWYAFLGQANLCHIFRICLWLADKAGCWHFTVILLCVHASIDFCFCLETQRSHIDYNFITLMHLICFSLAVAGVLSVACTSTWFVLTNINRILCYKVTKTRNLICIDHFLFTLFYWKLLMRRSMSL